MATLSAIFKAQDNVSRSLEGMDKQSNALMGTFKKLAGVMVGVFAGYKVAEFAKESTKAFIDFEKGMQEVFTLLPNASAESMDKMSAGVKEFSKKMGTVTTEVVPALYQALSAGVSQDTVFDFLEIANKAAIGGVTTLETAVDGLTSVTNSYGANVLSTGKASDLMFTTVKLGKTTFEELSGSLYNVVPTAVGAGVAFEDVSAALAAMTAQGVPTSVATTQLRQALVELSKSGSNTDKIFRQVSGQGFKEFIASGGNMQEAFQLLEKHAASAGLGINDLFGSVEAGNAVLALTGGGTEKFTQAMNAMQNASGATDTAFETMEKSLARKIDKLKANFEVFKLEVGGRLAGALNIAFDAASSFSGFLQGKFGGTIDSIKGKFALLGNGFNQFTEMIKSGETITHSFWNSFKGIFGEGVASVMSDFIGYFEFGIKGLQAFMKGDTSGAADFFYSMFPDEEGTSEKVNSIIGVLDKFKNIGSMLSNYFKSLNPIFKGLLSNISSYFKSIVPAVLGVFGNIIGVVEKIFVKVIPPVRNAIAAIANAIGGIMPIVSEMVNFVANKIMPILTESFEFIGTTVVPTVVNAFASWMPRIVSIVQNIWSLIKPILDNVVAVIQFVFPLIKDVVTIAINTIVGVLGGFMSILDGVIKFITGVFTGDWTKAWEGVKDIFGGIFDTLAALVKVPLNVVISLINKALSGINEMDLIIPKWVPIIGGKGFDINIPEIPMLAKGSTNAPNTFIAGERGPELITDAAGSRVFSNGDTQNILSRPIKVKVPSFDYMDDDETKTTEEKHIVLDINGSGELKFDSAASKESIVEILLEYLKPILMKILQEEIFEEGDLSYDF